MKVMLVEDEAVIRIGMKKLIENIIGGFTVVAEAENGSKALELIKTTFPDLIITDIRMNDMNGLELIERVHNQYSHIHALILSGHNDFEYAKKAMHFGVHDYLLKPVDRIELTLCLDKIKKKHEEHSQREIVSETSENVDEQNSVLIQKVKQIIHSRLDQSDLSLRYIAEQVYLNPQYLSFLFKSVTGQKYIDYVIQCKVDKAKRLLTITNLKVYEIAALVGYPNIKHFINTFRQTVGVPPTEFRKALSKYR